jgi:hypothetical protein
VKRLVTAIAAAAVALTAATSASAHVFTIHGDWKIGSFAVKRDGTLRGAVDAFGQPGSRTRHGEACTVRWPQHGLRIGFYNLGGRNPCLGRFGFFSNARAKGPHWRTNRGLEIGDLQSRLRDLYPNALFHSGEESVFPPSWWLVVRRSPFGTGGQYPGLLAVTQDRRITQFQVRFPAGGD